MAACNERGLKQSVVWDLLSSAQPVDLLPKSLECLQRDPARSGVTHHQMLDIHRQLEEERRSECDVVLSCGCMPVGEIY